MARADIREGFRADRRLRLESSCGGGADWEYRYAGDGVRGHVLKRRFTVDSDQTFVVTWTTTDADWTAQQPTFTTIMNTFEARAGAR